MYGAVWWAGFRIPLSLRGSVSSCYLEDGQKVASLKQAKICGNDYGSVSELLGLGTNLQMPPMEMTPF